MDNYDKKAGEVYTEPQKKKTKWDKLFLVLSMFLIIITIIFFIYTLYQYGRFKDPLPPLEIGDYGEYSIMLGTVEEMESRFGRSGRDLVLGRWYDKKGNFLPEKLLLAFDYDIFMVPVKNVVVGQNIFGKPTIINTFDIYLVDGEKTNSLIEDFNDYLKDDIRKREAKEGEFWFKMILIQSLEYDFINKETISSFRVKRKANPLISLFNNYNINEYLNYL